MTNFTKSKAHNHRAALDAGLAAPFLFNRHSPGASERSAAQL
jgi:hypothetical protein